MVLELSHGQNMHFCQLPLHRDQAIHLGVLQTVHDPLLLLRNTHLTVEGIGDGCNRERDPFFQLTESGDKNHRTCSLFENLGIHEYIFLL